MPILSNVGSIQRNDAPRADVTSQRFKEISRRVRNMLDNGHADHDVVLGELIDNAILVITSVSITSTPIDRRSSMYRSRAPENFR